MARNRSAYEIYLRSPEWQEKRQARLRYDGFRCTGCSSDGSETRLEVHHLTYDRLGHERIEDLMTLCHYCHCREHRRAPTHGVLPIAAFTRRELEARAELIRQQQAVLRQAERRQMPLVDRVRELEERAASGDQQAKRDLFMVDKHLDKFERRLARDTAAAG